MNIWNIIRCDKENFKLESVALVCIVSEQSFLDSVIN